jgi:branched-chain amino acid transport system substrate-binding protein
MVRMMGSLSRRRVLAVSAMALAAGIGFAGAAEAEVVKIGILAPMTGGAAADGEEMVRGATLAVEEINAAGGVAGYTFEIVPADVKEQSSEAVASAFERLSSDSAVQYMATGYASTTNFEIEMMAEAEMPYTLSANSAQTRDIIAPAPEDYPTVWSLTPSYDAYQTELVPVVQAMEAAGTVAFPNKKLAIISSDNPYSKTIYEGLKKSFTEAGWTITLDELVPFGEINDWRALLAKVRENPPDILINTDYLPGNAATFTTQFLEQPTNSLVFIQYAPSVPEYVNLTADKSTGIIYNLLGGPLNTPKSPRTEEVAKKFEARWGVESGTYGIALYEQMYIYFDALAKVGDPTDHLAIGKAMGETDKTVAQGHLAFDPATHLAKQGNDFIPIQFYQIWNGERVLFYPEQYATGSVQLPPWMTK